jgi:hypothetical protein
MFPATGSTITANVAALLIKSSLDTGEIVKSSTVCAVTRVELPQNWNPRVAQERPYEQGVSVIR